jgi:hypothetical protein
VGCECVQGCTSSAQQQRARQSLHERPSERARHVIAAVNILGQQPEAKMRRGAGYPGDAVMPLMQGLDGAHHQPQLLAPPPIPNLPGHSHVANTMSQTVRLFGCPLHRRVSVRHSWQLLKKSPSRITSVVVTVAWLQTRGGRKKAATLKFVKGYRVVEDPVVGGCAGKTEILAVNCRM